MIKKYLKEIWYLRLYIVIIAFAIGSSYSIYYFFDSSTVADLGEEDHFFEWLTAISLFIACGICFYLFKKTKNIFFILLAFLFLFGGGEEISWGQRIFGFKTPEHMKEINVQKEFSIHNIEIFNAGDFNEHRKEGLARLLEINFLFRLFMMAYGIVLPFLVFHLKFIQKFTKWIKVPVPPISIGIFFFVNWLIFWILFNYILSPVYGLQYMYTDSEIFECLGAFILLVICVYFLIDPKKVVLGMDIKDYLCESV